MSKQTKHLNHLGTVVWLRDEAEMLGRRDDQEPFSRLRERLQIPEAAKPKPKKTDSKIEGKNLGTQRIREMVDPLWGLRSLGIPVLDVSKVGVESIVSVRGSTQKDTKYFKNLELKKAKNPPKKKQGIEFRLTEGTTQRPDQATSNVDPGTEPPQLGEGECLDRPVPEGEEPGYPPMTPAEWIPTGRPESMDEFTRICLQNPLNCSINATGLQNLSLLNPKVGRGRPKIVPKFLNISSTQETVHRDSPNGTTGAPEAIIATDAAPARPTASNRLKNMSLIDIALDPKEGPLLSETQLLFDVQTNLKERIESLFYCPRAEDMMVRDYLKDAIAESKTSVGLREVTLDVFCDQYQFVARRHFGRAEFAAHLRRLLEDAGIKVPPKNSTDPTLNS